MKPSKDWPIGVFLASMLTSLMVDSAPADWNGIASSAIAPIAPAIEDCLIRCVSLSVALGFREGRYGSRRTLSPARSAGSRTRAGGRAAGRGRTRRGGGRASAGRAVAGDAEGGGTRSEGPAACPKARTETRVPACARRRFPPVIGAGSLPPASPARLTRRREQRDRPPPIPVDLPDDPRLRDIAVRDHDLTDYDGLAGKPEEDSET